jgi:hypothetical protein
MSHTQCTQEQSARLFLHCLKLMEVDIAQYRLLHGEVIVLMDALITALVPAYRHRLVISLLSTLLT